MKTQKQKRKRRVNYIAQKVIKKREIIHDREMKMYVTEMIKSNPQLHEKMKAQGSVSNAIDQLIPLGKELVQHPEIVEEMTANKKMQDEFCNNPTVTTQLLQIPEVADNAAREPSLIVEILKDASKIRTLTKSLSNMLHSAKTMTKKERKEIKEKKEFNTTNNDNHVEELTLMESRMRDVYVAAKNVSYVVLSLSIYYCTALALINISNNRTSLYHYFIERQLRLEYVPGPMYRQGRFGIRDPT
jgi:hypothetical protein